MKETQMMVHKNVLSMVVLAGGFLLGACTSTTSVESPDPGRVVTTPTPGPTPTPSPTVSEDPVVAAVKATIIGYYKDDDYLGQNPEDPDLTRVQKWTTGESVDVSVKDVLSTRRIGRLEGDTVIRDIQVFLPAVDKGAGPEITAVYCVDTSNGKLIKPDGSTHRPEVPAIENTTVLRLLDGKWLIDTVRNGEKKPC